MNEIVDMYVSSEKSIETVKKHVLPVKKLFEEVNKNTMAIIFNINT